MTSRRHRRSTIRDVACLSGVSVATVTRALQGHPRVHPDTRRRVEAAALKLSYRPDAIARALVTGASRTIGLLIPSSSDPFWGEVAAGCEERAGDDGYAVIFANSHRKPEREYRILGLFLEKQVDGIVVAAASGAHDAANRLDRPAVGVAWDAVERLGEFELAQRCPLQEAIEALSQDRDPGPWRAHVLIDDIGGAAAATRHLLALGHERVAVLAGPPVRPALLRLLGVRLALEEAGLEPPVVQACDEALDAAFEAALGLLQRTPRPTAIVAYSDVVAIGAVRAAHALRIRVPADVSVVGFDDIEFAGFMEPPLTTLRLPRHEMGWLAAQLLLEILAGGTPGAARTLQAELVVRGSTGPAP